MLELCLGPRVLVCSAALPTSTAALSYLFGSFAIDLVSFVRQPMQYLKGHATPLALRPQPSLIALPATASSATLYPS
ncbi:hypothetical protein [Sporisorium scitamineum]|uniref:Uncharacterized protein n=1 Tax=Sporisorium scitamineum TaxID=49012 RepID=A0A0F7SAT4_9BASI|nr:hypothetical protein [Sporisorium scitamineum]